MAMFQALNISATGMTAQRLRMDILSENIANVKTTRTEDGSPYVRKNVIFQEKDGTTSFQAALTAQLKLNHNYIGSGVKVTSIIEDTETPMNVVYEPSHPDADENGYVSYPNVNPVTEMTDLIDASRAYEANITAFNATKAMALKALEIGT
ncbi:MAG: flagellar basal body rod protein FlgC [Lachnospiraceae bacterium]|nr:flagellar basal body rod protein FlgC [Lachnospiraceae bacterium]